jgi:Ni/Co efflux regulator RcnB
MRIFNLQDLGKSLLIKQTKRPVQKLEKYMR